MDYERIHKPFTPQGGGFSPRRLRAKLLRVEARRKEDDDEVGDELSLRFEAMETDGRRAVYAETEMDTRSRDYPIGGLRFSGQELSGLSTKSSRGLSGFELQKSERAPPHRLLPAPVPVAPSKWGDAQKWIPSPTGGGQMKRVGLGGHGMRHGMVKVISGVEEPEETKRVDKEVAGVAESYSIMENPVADIDFIFSQHGSVMPLQNATTKNSPSPTVGSVSMRDMGTEMTPIPSQEPSRTATPVRATSPLCSPTSSQPPTPRSMVEFQNALAGRDDDPNRKELSQHHELLNNTQREIKADVVKTQTAAEAWEEAENAKYLAGFRREEVKIQAWENHQKEKIEAEMRNTEVKVERIRANAHEKMMKELAAARHKAEGMRAAAEAKRSQQASKASQQADYIRRTGRIPSSCCCWSCCS